MSRRRQAQAAGSYTDSERNNTLEQQHVADEKSGAPPSCTAEQAMNRVLAAERDAGRAVADCEARSRDIVQDARQRANRIASRTDERITLMQMRSAQRTAATLRQLQQAQQSLDDQAGEPLDDASVSVCMEDVAETLTTAAHGGFGKRDAGQ
ncbi:MAG: hypothetical protein OEN52_10740 [Gammaproteobacteria bacterium]|nr:hypothetical protein [Gammaproteobacteria bacterium]